MRYLITLIFMGFASGLLAQSTLTLKADEGSRIWLEGTSTLHDWECEAHDFSAELSGVGDNPSAVLSNAAFNMKVKIPVLSMKSSKGERMDKKMYETMKTDQYEEISYSLTAVRRLEGEGNKQSFETEGILTIAGATHMIAIVVHGESVESEELRLTGKVELDMEAFDIKPPKMFLGTLRTNKMVTVNFDLVMAQKEKM